MKQLLVRLAAATAIGAATVAAAATPAQASVIIGGIDVARQCRAQYGASWTATVLDPGNAYSWRCTYSGYANGVNMNSGCVNQYGAGAFAVLLDPNNAYSWRCAR